MRIAQVSPLYESVPPILYGGTERVVSYLTEALVELGHEVTLFASGDSRTTAKLQACVPRSLRLDTQCIDPHAHHTVMHEWVMQRQSEFDVIHFHTDYFHFPLSRRMHTPHLTTLHGRLDLVDLQPIYNEFSDQGVVSISDSQRAPLPQAHWLGTVHHGLPLELYAFHEGPGEYLAFLGRISPEKRVDRAVEIARALGWPLRIAAKVDRVDEVYFQSEIKPLLSDPLVDYVGEINEHQKAEFLGKASVLLFPIDWPEPFGLVMIEAMACGTPVVGYDHGSVSEVIEPGRNGFIVTNFEQAVNATRQCRTLERRTIRLLFEERYSSVRMAKDYLNLYKLQIAGKKRVHHDA